LDGAVVPEPGLLEAVNVAVCVPATTVEFAMIVGDPAAAPTSSRAVPLDRAVTVRVIPVPPGTGALIVISPWASICTCPFPVVGMLGT
jgi:hypothetical protein